MFYYCDFVVNKIMTYTEIISNFLKQEGVYMRKFFVFVCLLFLTLSINVYAKDDVKSIDSFIDKVINEWVESKDDICTWNENTDIDLVIPLYNTDDVINGYIYNLKTDNKKTGYIQVRCIGGNYQVVNLGFEGENYLESWMYQNNLSMDVLEYSKVYYLGNFAYFVKDERKQILLDLENKTEFDAWTDSMKKFEERFTEIFSQKSENRGIYSTAGTTVKVSNLSSASGYFRTTGYYSSYTNHCSPTAGTNLMLYWNKAKGYTSLESTQTTFFTSLYSRMGTSTTSGTLWSNIAPGLRSYANSKYPSLSVSCAPFLWS